MTQAPDRAAPAPTLDSLTSLRWWAAAAVFAFHARATADWDALSWANFGQSGVTFFFALSGFVLMWSVVEAPVDRQRFWLRRFARVYPGYLAVWVGTAAVGLLVHGTFGTSTAGLLLGVVMLQAWSGSQAVAYAADAPAWSLSAEAFFYGCFPWIADRTARLRPGALVAGMAGCVVVGGLVSVVLSERHLGSTWGFYGPLVRLPQFLAGVLLAAGMRRAGWRCRLPGAAVLGLGAAAVLVGDHTPYFPLRDYVLLPAVLLLLAWAATVDVEGSFPLFRHAVGVWLGQVSFAFYLLHQPALTLVAHGGGLSPAATTVVAFVVALAGAALLHHGVEEPCRRWITSGRAPRR